MGRELAQPDAVRANLLRPRLRPRNELPLRRRRENPSPAQHLGLPAARTRNRPRPEARAQRRVNPFPHHPSRATEPVFRPSHACRRPHELRPVFDALADRNAASGGLDRLPTAFLAQGAVWTILGYVAEAEGPALAAGLERGAAFARLFEAVDNAPEGNFSVAEMAKLVYLGESAFTKRFHAEMGVSPRTWFNDRRARAAAEALLEPDATVANVAERFGFGNEFYFSRFFRRHYGLPPSQWRSQCHI